MPLSRSTMSGTCTIWRFSSLHRLSSMYLFASKSARILSFGERSGL